MTTTVLIVGGSISGLLAATALSNFVKEVIVLEKDDISLCEGIQGEPLQGRPGTPQDQQGHGFLEVGRSNVEKLLPGFTEQILKNGARKVDRTNDFAWFRDSWKLKYKSNANMILFTRPLLERTVRSMINKQNRNIQFRHGARVVNFLFSTISNRIEGVILENGEKIFADLVIDAMGRTTSSEKWLQASGFEIPETTKLAINLNYVTTCLELEEGNPLSGEGMFIFPNAKTKRGGVLYRINPEGVSGGASPNKNYVLAVVIGYHESKPHCVNNDDFLKFAATLPDDRIYHVIKNAKFVYDAPKVFPIPYQSWKRYEKLNSGSFPENFLAIGDSVACLDPAFGQGMANASNQVMILQEYFRSGCRTSTFYVQQKIASTIILPFYMNGLEDTKYPETVGLKLPFASAARWFVRKAFDAGTHDNVVMGTLLSIAQLETSPLAMAKPNVLFRIFFPWLLTSFQILMGLLKK